MIAAALSLQDPRERPAEHAGAGRPAARPVQGRALATSSPGSTCGATSASSSGSSARSAFRRMCKREYLNYLRVREWQDFESQLRQVCKEMKIERRPARRTTPDADGIHQALLSGLLSPHRAARGARRRRGRRAAPMREYLGARGARFAIFPGSGLQGKNPQFVMAGELVETRRLWARQNAAIKPEWAERLGAHLVKRTYSEPHWSQEAGRGDGPRAGHAVRRTAGRRPARAATARSTRRWPASSSSGTRWSTASGTPGTASSPTTGGCSRRPRSSSTGPGAATSWSTSTRCSTSTTPGSAPTSSAARTSTSGGSRSGGQRPDLLTFDPAMLTHDTADEVRAADYPEQWQSREGLTFPISYHFEPGRGRRRPHHRRPGRHAQPGRGRRLLLERARPARGAGHQPDPQPAQEPAGQLRAGAQHGARVPRRGAAGRGAAARRARALPALDHRRASCRARRGTGPRCPTHLRPTYRVVDDDGARAGARQGPRGAQGAAAAAVRRRRSPRSPPTPGSARTGQTTWTFGTIERVVHPDAGRPRGARLPGAGRRGRDGRAAGLRLRRRGRGPAPARRTPAAAARASPAGRR